MEKWRGRKRDRVRRTEIERDGEREIVRTTDIK